MAPRTATAHGAAFRTAGALPVLAWPALDALGVQAVVTTRHGGTSGGPYESLNLGLHVGDDPHAVGENRRRAATALGCGVGDLVLAAQVHGHTPAVVTDEHRGRGAHRPEDAITGADALVTDRPGLALVVLVADCVPIVLVDPVARVLAAVHAGWRGTAGRVVERTLAVMCSLGARPERLVAGIGPAVSPLTYEVGPEVAAAAASLPDEPGTALVAAGPGRWLFDLPGANRRQLLRAGVPAGAVHRTPEVTGPPGPFFSHRAARPCGRFALMARLGA